MPTLLFLCRLVLAGVFGVAAAAKLAAPDETRATLEEFGLGERAARIAAPVLPLAEAAVAVALLIAPTARVGAIGAAVLLGLFSLAVAVNLARGRRPDCNCFGTVHSAPIGPATLVRNLVLLAVAVLVGVAGPGRSAFAWLGRLSTAELVLTIAVAALAVCLTGARGVLVRALPPPRALLLSVDALEAGAPEPVPAVTGLPAGTAAPEFALPGLDGETMTLAALRAHGRPVLLLFTDPECGPGRAMRCCPRSASGSKSTSAC
jgi:uncharacterized membrane protein YphA (DoxX/SURF4 family)